MELSFLQRHFPPHMRVNIFSNIIATIFTEKNRMDETRNDKKNLDISKTSHFYGILDSMVTSSSGVKQSLIVFGGGGGLPTSLFDLLIGQKEFSNFE